jgi:FkbM family methyltransferase
MPHVEPAPPAATAASHFSAAADHVRAAAAELERATVSFKAGMALDPTDTAATQTLLWTLGRYRRQHPEYFSESFQDRFLNETIFQNRRGGVFVDIGAHDGITGSNTLFFEKFRGWTGLCIEPDADRFAELQAMRGVPCVNTCISAHNGEAAFYRVRQGFTQMGGLVATFSPGAADFLAQESIADAIILPTRRLDDVLEAYGLRHIDYLSIDIEGAEFSVLNAIDFNRFSITALSVERNAQAASVHTLLRTAGFCRVRQLGRDDIFVRADHVLAEAAHLVSDMTGEAVRLHQHGDAPQAEALYRDILRLDRQNPGIYYNLALALIKQADDAAAKAVLAEALYLWPDFELAHATLAKLGSARESKEAVLF